VKLWASKGAMRDPTAAHERRECGNGGRDVALKWLSERSDWRNPVRSGRARMVCKFAKVACPLGVVGIIYESRPKVTVDTAVLALKTGNAISCCAAAKKRRSKQFRSSEILLQFAELPEGGNRKLLDSSKRRVGGRELIKLVALVDVIIPRGGRGD